MAESAATKINSESHLHPMRFTLLWNEMRMIKAPNKVEKKKYKSFPIHLLQNQNDQISFFFDRSEPLVAGERVALETQIEEALYRCEMAQVIDCQRITVHDQLQGPIRRNLITLKLPTQKHHRPLIPSRSIGQKLWRTINFILIEWPKLASLPIF